MRDIGTCYVRVRVRVRVSEVGIAEKYGSNQVLYPRVAR